MTNWIQNCQICNDGLCIRMEDLKKTGLSDRRAAEVMQEEAYDSYPDLKTEFSASRIRDRYRYHMQGKKVGEIPPPDSQFAGWPMCKVCGSNRVVEKPHWDGSGKPLEPEEHGQCQSCYNDQLPKCKSCGTTLYGNVFGHGLCRFCRKKDLRGAAKEDVKQRLDERQKEFDETPVDTETEEFWTDLIEKWEPIEDTMDGIPCGKVGDETLARIEEFRSRLKGLVYCLNDVVTESEVSVKVQ